MSWLLSILAIILTVSHLSEAKHVRKLPSAIVVGTVYCDTCFQENLDKSSHFISGASVAVECKYGKASKPVFREEVKTNKHGEFKVHLPFSVSKHVKKIEGCSVKLISSNEPYCSVASTATSSSLHLKSRKQGTHIFSAGFFTFKPLKQPFICNQKSSIQNPKKPFTNDLNKKPSLHSNNPDLTFPPPLRDPEPPSGLPPIPGLPFLPPLPNLPSLPPLPLLPIPGGVSPVIPGTQKAEPKPIQSSLNSHHEQTYEKETTPDFFFPPNPFQPPLIPNPFQPPPLIPNPFQPPPAPLIPNPFQPPPAPLIPNPFQPPPTPAPLIPNPFQPPPTPAPLFPNPFQPPPTPTPAPLFPNPFQPPPAPTPRPLFPPFPPINIPGFTSSPPPPSPPPPLLPFPFPPFPFPFPAPPSPRNPPPSSSP